MGSGAANGGSAAGQNSCRFVIIPVVQDEAHDQGVPILGLWQRLCTPASCGKADDTNQPLPEYPVSSTQVEACKGVDSHVAT